MVETAFEQFDHMIIIEADKYIASLFAGADESLVTQAAQLMGDGGFGDTQAIHQFANSNFPIQQGGDDQNACRVT